jgi:hypothetical protein
MAIHRCRLHTYLIRDRTMTPSLLERASPQQSIPLVMARHALTAVVLVVCLSACSRSGNDGAAIAAAPAPPAMSTAVPSTSSDVAMDPVDNACALLADAEVRNVFPDAAAGKRNTESLQYGLDRCAWKTPTGQIGVEVSHVEAAAFEKELRAELQGAVDPRMQHAADQIVFHRVDGIGDHAIAVLEEANAQRGIYADIALLAIQRRHRMAVLMVHPASAGAPSPALESLQELGRRLAMRL